MCRFSSRSPSADRLDLTRRGRFHCRAHILDGRCRILRWSQCWPASGTARRPAGLTFLDDPGSGLFRVRRAPGAAPGPLFRRQRYVGRPDPITHGRAALGNPGRGLSSAGFARKPIQQRQAQGSVSGKQDDDAWENVIHLCGSSAGGVGCEASTFATKKRFRCSSRAR